MKMKSKKLRTAARARKGIIELLVVVLRRLSNPFKRVLVKLFAKIAEWCRPLCAVALATGVGIFYLTCWAFVWVGTILAALIALAVLISRMPAKERGLAIVFCGCLLGLLLVLGLLFVPNWPSLVF
jgi:hypothetical protein